MLFQCKILQKKLSKIFCGSSLLQVQSTKERSLYEIQVENFSNEKSSKAESSQDNLRITWCFFHCSIHAKFNKLKKRK